MKQGLAAIGIKPGADFNSGSLSGSSWVPTTIRLSRESRNSSEIIFLSETMSKTGVTVYAITMGKNFYSRIQMLLAVYRRSKWASRGL